MNPKPVSSFLLCNYIYMYYYVDIQKEYQTITWKLIIIFLLEHFFPAVFWVSVHSTMIHLVTDIRKLAAIVKDIFLSN